MSLPPGWTRVQLRDVLKYEQPWPYLVNSEDYRDEYKVPVLTAGKSFILGYTNETDGIYHGLPVVIFDDFTTASKYVDFPFKVKSSAMKILSPLDDSIDLKYVFWYMQTLRIDTTIHKRYYISTYQDLFIDLPPIQTQKKIVQALESCKNAIDYNARATLSLRKYLASKFHAMFGNIVYPQQDWPVMPFEYFAKIDTTMTSDFDHYQSRPHIGIESIERDTGKLKNYKTVGESNLTSGKYVFSNKHIIYSKIRPNLNKVALPSFTGLCSADAYPILPVDGNANRYFLAYVLRSQFFLKHIARLSRRANIPKANKSQIKSFSFAAVPISLQDEFANDVKRVLKIERLQEDASNQLKLLFSSLRSRALKGELLC